MRFNFDTIKRLWRYIKQNNKAKIALASICIILNTISTVAGSLYLQTLIDDYITPLIGTENPNYLSLLTPVLTMISIYAVRNYHNIYIYKSNG